MQLWAAQPSISAELPVLPGLLEGARQGLGAQAQAAITPAAVIAATTAGGLGLHDPAEGRMLTGVDQIALEDLSSFAVGVLVVQSLLTGAGQLRAVDVDNQELWPELQARLDEWLKAGRIKLADFLPVASPLELDLGAGAAPEPTEYQQRHRAALAAGRVPDGIELLASGAETARAAQWVQAIQHTLLLFVPRLTSATMRPGLLSALNALAERGVITVIGWGAADDRAHEAEPSADALDTLAQLITPDGFPGVLSWWVGGLYGQDAVADQLRLASTLPNVLLDPTAPSGPPAAAGVTTYLVTDLELVGTAVEDLEPALARATRQAWQGASRDAEADRQTLVAACQTWVAVRRPGEALSHLLKLAADLAEESPAAMRVAWEALTAICISLAPLPAADLADMGAPEALRRAIPEFLDWANSASPAAGEAQPPFVAALHELLVRHSLLEADDLPKLLGEIRQRWLEIGHPAAATGLAQAFAGPASEASKSEKPKKRR